jgi:hypothetical protein
MNRYRRKTMQNQTGKVHFALSGKALTPLEGDAGIGNSGFDDSTGKVVPDFGNMSHSSRLTFRYITEVAESYTFTCEKPENEFVDAVKRLKKNSLMPFGPAGKDNFIFLHTRSGKMLKMLRPVFAVCIHYKDGMSGKIFGHIGDAQSYGFLMAYIPGEIHHKILTFGAEKICRCSLTAAVVYPAKNEIGKKCSFSFLTNGFQEQQAGFPVVENRNNYKNGLI